MNVARLVAALAFALASGVNVAAEAQRFITIASTTSTEQSGLFRHMLPIFTKTTGIQVRVIALGTGQALDTARRGDADVVFVHAKEAELKFIAEGYGVARLPVMYNDFVLIGPKSDSAKVSGTKDIVEALRKIRSSGSVFISRDDRSGTHMAELDLWRFAGIDISAERSSWYRSTGHGMGPALNAASSMNAYLLADRGTWIAFKNRGDLAILVEGDKRLFNQYGVILVSAKKHPHVKSSFGQAFIDWVVSPAGQRAIADHKIDGQQLFYPNAHDASA
jgi:tungstate transport system substrate-binding protein